MTSHLVYLQSNARISQPQTLLGDLALGSRQLPFSTLYQKKDYSKHIFVQARITELFDSEVKWNMQQYDIEQNVWTSSIVTASGSIKFGELTTHR